MSSAITPPTSTPAPIEIPENNQEMEYYDLLETTLASHHELFGLIVGSVQLSFKVEDDALLDFLNANPESVTKAVSGLGLSIPFQDLVTKYVDSYKAILDFLNAHPEHKEDFQAFESYVTNLNL